MSSKKIALFFAVIAASSAAAFSHHAVAAAVLAEQTDGSLKAGMQTSCNNGCSDIVAATQTFTATASGTLGAIEVFTANFGTDSRYPEGNTCYLTVADDDTGTNLATSDNDYNGYSCGGDLLFTFKNAGISLAQGHRYRWSYVFGAQNFSSIMFLGTANDTIGGSFSLAPFADAKFAVYAAIEPPAELTQFDDQGAPIPEGGTDKGSSASFAAILPSPATDTLQLQVEFEPSFVPFANTPNLLSSFGSADATATVDATSPLTNGGFHWQARAADMDGNTSAWIAPASPPADADLIAHDPSSGIVLQDTVTSYARNTQPNPCFGDGTPFACALAPTSTLYITDTPFALSKVVFVWRNAGSNNCDGYGNYGLVITSANDPSSIIASSTNTVYMGCSGDHGPSEFDFPAGTTIPSSFRITIAAFDNLLQGGSDITVWNIQFFGTPVAVSPSPISTSATTTDATTATTTPTESTTISEPAPSPIIDVPASVSSNPSSSPNRCKIKQ